MKNILRLIILTVGIVLTDASPSLCAGCGIEPVEIKPIPPVGCKDVVHKCVCASTNNCYWAWVCVK